jgi:hypothetical protein
VTTKSFDEQLATYLKPSEALPHHWKMHIIGLEEL